MLVGSILLPKSPFYWQRNGSFPSFFFFWIIWLIIHTRSIVRVNGKIRKYKLPTKYEKLVLWVTYFEWQVWWEIPTLYDSYIWASKLCEICAHTNMLWMLPWLWVAILASGPPVLAHIVLLALLLALQNTAANPIIQYNNIVC